MLRLVLVAMLVSCGGGESSTAPGVASGVAADAGKVREVAGNVTATRGGETRTLTVGMPINAADMIDTGTDGSVVIELAHNNALWSLEPGIKARVDQSPAWTLAMQEKAAPLDHATSSAGRHADRQAADTQITAVEGAKKDLERAPEQPAGASAAAPTTTPKPPVAPRRPTTASSSEAQNAVPAKPVPACDEVSCALDPSAACCARYPKSRGDKAPGGGDVPDSPSAAEIRSAINAAKQKFVVCAEKANAKGRFQIKLQIDAEGKVPTAQMVQSPDPAADACILAAFRAIKFPRSRNGVSVTYPLVIN